MNTQYLIQDKTERYQRNADNMQCVIQFLIQETYSTITNLMVLLNYQKRQPLDRLLAKLKGLDLIKKYELKTPRGKLALWGVTDLGLAQNQQKSNGREKSFVPYRVTAKNAEHKMKVQFVQLQLQKNGWCDWENGKHEDARKKYQVAHKPDGLVKSPSGAKIALELMQTIQTPSRYRTIFKDHIQAKKEGYWHAVFFIVESNEMKKLLENHFNKIEYIRFKESKHPFEYYCSNLYRIFTLEEVKTLQETREPKR
ncbi:MobC family replication-relaxation protein [Vibrio parahaemolyticus]|nr:MobC family replication-relaxation protein [Vibrio parahaemolyticus]